MMLMPSVVVVGSPQDAEVSAVLSHLDSGEYLLIDDDWLRRDGPLSWRLDGNGPSLGLGASVFTGTSIRSVLFRPRLRRNGGALRPTIFNTDPSICEEDRPFIQNESETVLLAGLADATCLWVNHPGADTDSDLKLHQLPVAHRLGLRVPETLVSTDSEELRAFWHRHDGHVITKSISGSSRWFTDEAIVTRRVAAEDLASLSGEQNSPVLFQQMIPAARDLRVTIVGDEFFGTAIHSQEGAGLLDWRLDYTVRFVPFELPEPDRSMLFRLASQLQLAYGAADFRLTPDGEPIFLEINARGAWWFVEKLTGQPISQSLAELLRRGVVERMRASVHDSHAGERLRVAS